MPKVTQQVSRVLEGEAACSPGLFLLLCLSYWQSNSAALGLHGRSTAQGSPQAGVREAGWVRAWTSLPRGSSPSRGLGQAVFSEPWSPPLCNGTDDSVCLIRAVQLDEGGELSNNHCYYTIITASLPSYPMLHPRAHRGPRSVLQDVSVLFPSGSFSCRGREGREGGMACV